MFFFKRFFLITAALLIFGCGDNLFPSGEDKRPTVTAGSTGGSVNQKSPDFSLSSTTGTEITRDSSFAGKKAAVFYFTMWCPICDSHQSSLRTAVVPQFPDINFYLVDYVSGTVADAANAASASGYTDFVTLADTSKTMLNAFGATMGTTVVIDSSGTVRMNEDYKDGTPLRTLLQALP